MYIFFNRKENLDYDTYVTYIDDLAKSKGMDATEIKDKLSHTAEDVKPKIADAAVRIQAHQEEFIRKFIPFISSTFSKMLQMRHLP